MELVDVTDSKSVGGNIVWVRVPPPAPRRRGLRIVRDDFFCKKSSLIHSVAPPFQITTASLGCDLVLGADLKSGASKLFALSTSEQSPLCSDVLLFLHLAVMRHVFPFWSYKNL